jgi:hypothetical protein
MAITARPLTQGERTVVAHALRPAPGTRSVCGRAEDFAGARGGVLLFTASGRLPSPARILPGRSLLRSGERTVVARALVRHAGDVATPPGEADRAAGLASLFRAAALCRLTMSAPDREHSEGAREATHDAVVAG